MRHLKEFENHQDELISKFKNGNWSFDKLFNRDKENDYIYHCLSTYVEMKVGEHFDNMDKYYCEIDKNQIIRVEYYDKRYMSSIYYNIENEELEDFIKYLNNPDIYTDTKKYNL